MRLNVDDAASRLGFVSQKLEYVERTVNETIFPEIVYPALIPVDTSAGEWTDSILYSSMEHIGHADWINGNSNDVPAANANYTETRSDVHMAAVGYEYGYAEIGKAMATGQPLTTDKAMAARLAYERFVDRVAILGDTTKNMTGLVNAAGITIDSATGLWSNASTEDQILADVNNLISGTAEATQYNMAADTLLVPYKVFTYLASTPLSSKEGGTLLSFIQQYNTHTATTGQPLLIRGIPRLDTAGAGGVGRAVAYTRNPLVLKLHIPMPHRFLPAQAVGLNVSVPGVFRLGGLEIRQTEAVRYIDGV